MFRKKLYKKAAASVIYLTAATIFLPKVSAEETVEIPGTIMLLSFDTWQNRNLRVIGNGKKNLVIYGGRQAGNVYNLSINPKNQPVNLYGGYYDGILDNTAENIMGNEINFFDGDAGWLVYDDPNKIGNGYNVTNIFSKNDSAVTVNLIAGHSGLGEVYGNKINLYGGVVFRTKLNDGKFYSGSIRAGRIKTDFESDSFGAFQNVHENFKSNSHYIGAHIGVGREIRRSPKEIFTYSAKFLFSHTGADTVTLTTGEDHHLSSVNSYRIKVGIDEEYEPNNIHNFYIGAGVEYEFNGKSYAEHGGFRTDTPSLKGFSGIFELGWIIKPRGDNKFSLDLSGVGSVGKNRGLTGRFGVNWRF